MMRILLTLLSYSLFCCAWAHKQYDTIIIGAGVAGLTAAKTLHEKQQSVLILEAKDRLGGRVHSDYDWGFALELGASWVHGVNNNPLLPLIGNRSLILNSYDNSVLTAMLRDFALYTSEGKPVKAEGMRMFYTLTKDFLRYSKTHSNKESFEEIFNQFSVEKEISPIQRAILHYALDNIYTYEFGENLSKLSQNIFSTYEGSSVSGKNALLPEGYFRIFQTFSENIPIQLNQVVQRIEYDKQGVRVHTQNNIYHAKEVVITVPLGVLKSNKIQFHPQLPFEKTKAIDALEMGNYEKIYLLFDQVFWDKEKEWIGMLSNSSNSAFNIFNYYKYTQKPVLIVFTSGQLARDMDKGKLSKWIMRRLRSIYGENIPNPIKIKRTHWASDPYTLGSYSYLPIGVDKRVIADLAKPVDSKVYFAGEATSTTDPSTVHGAYLSGIRAANEILDHLKLSSK